MLYEFMTPFDNKLEEWGQEQFSQFGEDTVVWAWLETLGLLNRDGFYVDVGAHHPRRGSNTYLLRKLLGWSGINIEPDPALFAAFPIECPECVNLNVAIGESAGEVELTIYNHPGANTASDALKARQAADPRMVVTNVISVPMLTLNEVLEKYLSRERQFNLLTVDAEGLDYEIVSSLDTVRFRPPLVLVEDFEFDLRDARKSRIFNFLNDVGYFPVSHCMVTTLYRNTRK